MKRKISLLLFVTIVLLLYFFRFNLSIKEQIVLDSYSDRVNLIFRLIKYIPEKKLSEFDFRLEEEGKSYRLYSICYKFHHCQIRYFYLHANDSLFLLRSLDLTNNQVYLLDKQIVFNNLESSFIDINEFNRYVSYKYEDLNKECVIIDYIYLLTGDRGEAFSLNNENEFIGLIENLKTKYSCINDEYFNYDELKNNYIEPNFSCDEILVNYWSNDLGITRFKFFFKKKQLLFVESRTLSTFWVGEDLL